MISELWDNLLQRMCQGSDPDSCPRISATGDANEITVAHGSKLAIKVKVHGIAESFLHARFVCQFYIEGSETRAHAQLVDNTVICDSVEFVYTATSPTVTVPFDVVWGGSKILDNQDQVHGKSFRY